MSERYQRLYALPSSLYAEGAPIILLAGALLKDTQTGSVLVQLKFKSVSNKCIKALKITVQPYDIVGAVLGMPLEHQYLDLSVNRDTEFGQKTAVLLPDTTTRSFTCQCVAVVFDDGTSWNMETSNWLPLASLTSLSAEIGTLIAQYRRETIDKAQFVVSDDRDLWFCTCGAMNKRDELICHSCHSEKAFLSAMLDKNFLEEREAEFLQEEHEKKKAAERELEQIKKEKAAKREKLKVPAIIIGIALALLVAIYFLLITPILKEKHESTVGDIREYIVDTYIPDMLDKAGAKEGYEVYTVDIEFTKEKVMDGYILFEGKTEFRLMQNGKFLSQNGKSIAVIDFELEYDTSKDKLYSDFSDIYFKN